MKAASLIPDGFFALLFPLSSSLTSYQCHVLVMVSDPKPNQVLIGFKSQSTIVITNLC